MPNDAERSPIILPPRSEIKGEPEQSHALRGPRPRRRRTGFFVSLALVVLTVIVVLTGLFIHFGSINSLSPGKQATVAQEHTGPFVKPPYPS
jgi:hypothetical protein